MATAKTTAKTTAAIKPKPNLDVSVSRPTPYTFDLGLLLANDPNPITTSSSSEDSSSSAAVVTSSTTPPPTTASETGASDPVLEVLLRATARSAAQGLVNQLLTTCPLSSTSAGVLLTLPRPQLALPRSRPLPKPREPTRWESFAARRGIKPKSREQRRAKLSWYNDQTGAWERSWGYDRKALRKRKEEGAVQDDWIVEVDAEGKREGKGNGKDRKKKNNDKKGKDGKRRKA